MVSKICHLERSKSSQTHEMFSLALLLQSEMLKRVQHDESCHKIPHENMDMYLPLLKRGLFKLLK